MMNLEDIMLREISQIQGDKYYLITESNKVETVDIEGKKVIARGCRSRQEVGNIRSKRTKFQLHKMNSF